MRDSEIKFSQSFKGGQDWEYVKYKLGGMLEVDSDNIVKYFIYLDLIP